jgi:LPXTG-motif cell wall-anchored protein
LNYRKLSSKCHGAIMEMFRHVIGVPLTAVGFVLTMAAVCLIAKTGGKSPYMYIVWGLGLLTLMLGVKFLPKKKKRGRSASYAGRSLERPDSEKQEPHD